MRPALAVAALIARAAAATTTFPANYQGMYLGPRSAESISCATDEVFITRNGYAQCCLEDSNECYVATACADSTIFYEDDIGTYDCGTEFSCVTMTIYQTSPFGGPVMSQYFCARNWVANTIYRELPATTTTETSVTSGAQTSPTSSAPSNTGEADPNQTNSGDSGSGSQAWIVGPVVGGIAGVGLLGALAFWIGRRRATKSVSPGGATPAIKGPDAEMAMAGGMVGGMAATPSSNAPYGSPSNDYSPGFYDNKGQYWQTNGAPSSTTTTSPGAASAWGGYQGYGTPQQYPQQWSPQGQQQMPASELPSVVPIEMSGEDRLRSELDGGVMEGRAVERPRPELDGTPGVDGGSFTPYRG